MEKGVRVYSEIGKLRKVILHRPGEEINNVSPDTMQELLFDEVPYLDQALKEHDYFANILKESGCEVYYLEDLVADVIKDKNLKESLIEEFLDEADLHTPNERYIMKDILLQQKSEKDIVMKMIAGTRMTELTKRSKETLADFSDADRYFLTVPMPNAYFTRDPFANIGHGVAINKMWSNVRRRETLFGKYIYDHHEMFKGVEVPRWYDREDKFHTEGGDQLILSKDVLAVGISQRTEAAALQKLAENVLLADEFKTVLAINIPQSHAFMHLDTVFTMIDKDKFTIHPEIEGPLVVYSMVKDGDKVKITEEKNSLDKILAHYLGVDKVDLIRCGGGLGIDAQREQWNDGSNTLAIAPGEVVVYDRNVVTNDLLEKEGIKLHRMPSYELSRGRGGPRCMSMPLYREDVK